MKQTTSFLNFCSSSEAISLLNHTVWFSISPRCQAVRLWWCHHSSHGCSGWQFCSSRTWMAQYSRDKSFPGGHAADGFIMRLCLRVLRWPCVEFSTDPGSVRQNLTSFQATNYSSDLQCNTSMTSCQDAFWKSSPDSYLCITTQLVEKLTSECCARLEHKTRHQLASWLDRCSSTRCVTGRLQLYIWPSVQSRTTKSVSGVTASANITEMLSITIFLYLIDKAINLEFNLCQETKCFHVVSTSVFHQM